MPTGSQGTQAWDRYAYANNSPVRYTDPSGHNWLECKGGSDYRCQIHQNKVAEAFENWAQQQSQTINVLFCGWDGIPCGTGGALAPYDNNVYVDCMGPDGKLTKVECYNNFVNNILPTLDPTANLILIGHSAGADAAILAADYLLQNNQGSRLKGLILLDPSLTATVGGTDYDQDGGLMPMLSGIIKSGIPVFLGDSIGSGSDNESGETYRTATKLLDPEQNRDLWPYFNYAYFAYDLSHMDLATDLTVHGYATWFIDSYYLPWPQAIHGR